MKIISAYSIPVLILFVVISAFFKKIPVYDTFTEGAKKGFKSSVSIAVPVMALLSAIYMFRTSGAIDLICKVISPLTNLFHIPSEVIPLALLRPVSGSGAIALVSDIFDKYGTDSKIGQIASVLCGSSETTFYTIAVYFGAVGIKNIRYTAKVGVLADLTALFVSTAVINLIS